MRVSPRRTASAAICACAASCAASAVASGSAPAAAPAATRPPRRELLGALEVGARQRGRRLRLRERAARGRQLIGQIARPHQRQQLAALDAVAAIDQHGVEVAERLRADVGLGQRPQIDRGAHLDRHVARLDARDRHQRGRPRYRLVGGLPAASAGQQAKGGGCDRPRAVEHGASIADHRRRAPDLPDTAKSRKVRHGPDLDRVQRVKQDLRGFAGASPSGEKVTIDFEGTAVPAFAGEPVAAALFAAGVRTLGRSTKYHRPRGLFCLDGHCASCTMRIDGRPNRRACMVPARAGLACERQNAFPSADVDLLAAADWLFPARHGPPHLDDGQPDGQRGVPEDGARDGRLGHAARRADAARRRRPRTSWPTPA